MKNSKKGISLIVLIITIVVIIILAAAVILTLSKNNPVDSAKSAVMRNDYATVQDTVTLYVYNYMAQHEGNSPLGASGATLGATTVTDEPTKKVTKIGWADLGIDKKGISDTDGTWSVDQHGKVTAPAGYQPE